MLWMRSQRLTRVPPWRVDFDYMPKRLAWKETMSVRTAQWGHWEHWEKALPSMIFPPLHGVPPLMSFACTRPIGTDPLVIRLCSAIYDMFHPSMHVPPPNEVLVQLSERLLHAGRSRPTDAALDQQPSVVVTQAVKSMFIVYDL